MTGLRREFRQTTLHASLLLALIACAPGHSPDARSPNDCPGPIERRAAQLDRGDLPALVGRFRLVMVMTSHPGKSKKWWITRSELTLALADSTRKAESRTRRLGYMRRADLQLVGQWDWSKGKHPPELAELDGRILFLGCRDCNDASPDVLRITSVSRRGFSGSWRNYQTGIGVAVDAKTKRTVPDPAGFFCAIRRGDGLP